MSLTKFWLCRSPVELRQRRGLRRQVFMLACVPKERNLILLLFFATSMQRLQVSFRFGGYYMPSGNAVEKYSKLVFALHLFWRVCSCLNIQLKTCVYYDEVIWLIQLIISMLCHSGAFTTNVVAAAPVVYCKKTLDSSKTVCWGFILDLVMIVRKRRNDL